MNSGRVMNMRVTIPAESRRMNVGKDVIRILGSPAYICVLQRKDRKSIAITPCAAEHPMSFKVPDRLLTDGQCRMMINGIQFIQVLLEANGLVAGKECADELDEEIRALTKQASEKTYIGGLTKECVDAFVSMVYLYDDQTMKIEFNCEDVIRRALEKYGA